MMNLAKISYFFARILHQNDIINKMLSLSLSNLSKY